MQLESSTLLADFTIKPVSLVQSGAAVYHYLNSAIHAGFLDHLWRCECSMGLYFVGFTFDQGTGFSITDRAISCNFRCGVRAL